MEEDNTEYEEYHIDVPDKWDGPKKNVCFNTNQHNLDLANLTIGKHKNIPRRSNVQYIACVCQFNYARHTKENGRKVLFIRCYKI
jgi:hypothetical protein